MRTAQPVVDLAERALRSSGCGDRFVDLRAFRLDPAELVSCRDAGGRGRIPLSRLEPVQVIERNVTVRRSQHEAGTPSAQGHSLSLQRHLPGERRLQLQGDRVTLGPLALE